MNSAQTVAAEVRAELARQRISGRQAALRLGWTPPYLSRRLVGEIPFNVDDLHAIAGLLDLPVTAFFETKSGNRSFSCAQTSLRLAA